MHEFFSPHVGTETSLSYHEVSACKSHAVCDDAGVAVSDVGEGPPVDERWISLKRLGDVGQKGLAKDKRHGSCTTDVFGLNLMTFG